MANNYIAASPKAVIQPVIIVGTSANGSVTTATSLPPYPVTSLGYVQVPTSNLAAAYTLSPPANSVFASIQAESGVLRWRDDGNAPTSNVGMLMFANTLPQIFSGDLTTLKFIEANGSNTAILNITFYM